MDSYLEGLRCQDVNAGLRSVDPNSPGLVELKRTRLVGMAADVAALIRGRELIPDASALEAVAVSELDVDSYAFEQVLNVLAEAEFVELTRDSRGQVTGLTENVPIYRNLYEELGRGWRDRGPREFEQQVVAVVDRLARGPVPLESLADVVGISSTDAGRLVPLGRNSGLLRTVSTIDGEVAYSPFTGFEHPDVLDGLLATHGPELMLEEFEALKNNQGLVVDASQYPLIADAVARGLLLAPTVELPDSTEQAFATLPYSLDRELLMGRKPVLDKALAVIACVRCAEQFGGYSNARAGVHLINTLLREGSLNPHSFSERQYRMMRNRGIIVFGPDDRPGGSWVRPTLVNTEDNREALVIARDMLLSGEPMEAGRQLPESKRDMLGLDARYLQPLQTAARNRNQVRIPDREYSRMFDALMGRGSL